MQISLSIMKCSFWGLAVASFVTSAHAVVIGFEAESGTLGAEFDPAIADAEASGGFYITTETDNPDGGTTIPGSDAATATYTFDLAAGTYDVYVKAGLDVGAAGGNDSFYWATSFGDADPTAAADWELENGASGFLPGVPQGSFGWSLSLGQITTSSGGTVTWKIGAREDGFWMDAFAFATDGTDVGRSATGQSTILDNAVAVPEPSSFALLAGILSFTWVMLRRR